MFGIETFYRREEDGSLSLKLQGEVSDVPLFEQLCILREVDLYYKWSPFCSSSFTVADLDKLDTVGWFLIGLSAFGLARDGCFRAIGCDNFMEDGSVLLAGQGLHDIPDEAPPPADTYLSDDPIIDTLPIPPKPTRRGADRMTIRTFDAIIHVTSPTSATTKIVANIDPNIRFLPQSLLEFVMKHMAGVLLAKLQSAAKKVVKHPKNNEHAKKMRQEADFYQAWLMAKFQAICEMRGWTMPPVTAFEVAEDDWIKDTHHSAAAAVMARSAPSPSTQQPQSLASAHPMARSATFHGGGGGTPLTTASTSASRTRTRTVSEGVEFPTDYNATHDQDWDDSLHSNEPLIHVVASDRNRRTTNHSDEDNRSQSAVSDISSVSGRSWYDKPVRTYIHKREERKAAKKQEEIRAIRNMAAERLVPKPRSPTQRDRLVELREAKAQRLGGGAMEEHEQATAVVADADQLNSPPSEDDDQSISMHSVLDTLRGSQRLRTNRVKRKSVSERITDRLQAHGKRKRFWVMSLVLTLLFILLNPELFELFLSSSEYRRQYGNVLPWTRQRTNVTTQPLSSEPVEDTAMVEVFDEEKGDNDEALETALDSEPEPELEEDKVSLATMILDALFAGISLSWQVTVSVLKNGVGLLCYMCSCAILHFFACDIALVYAFNALDVGSKAGRQVKKYYSDNVRLVVAAMSFGIYALAICKALAQVALSSVLWLIYHPQVFVMAWNDWIVGMVLGGKGSSLDPSVLTNGNVTEWIHSTFTNATEALESTSFDMPIAEMAKEAAKDGFHVLQWMFWIFYRGLVLPLVHFGFAQLEVAASLVDWTGGQLLNVETAWDSWQRDAFETGRLFFSYSAVPLLTFLFLFNASARWARRDSSKARPPPPTQAQEVEPTIRVAADTATARSPPTNQAAAPSQRPSSRGESASPSLQSPPRTTSRNASSSSHAHSHGGGWRPRRFRKSKSAPDLGSPRRGLRFLRRNPHSNLGVVEESNHEAD